MIHEMKNILKRFLGRPGWYGDYASWQEAKSKSSGYDSKVIVEKVKEALLRVKNNEVAFERDSVTFSEFEYVWPVLGALLWVAAQKKGKLRVIDFGGSLGSTFFQYRKFFDKLDVNWNIVEQDLFVEYGTKYFENERLKFFFTIEDCLKASEVDVFLLSSVLPYVEKPYEILDMILRARPEFLIFDKMPFRTEGNRDLITIQFVPDHIYRASYPAWFFDKTRFIKVLKENYEIIAEFPDEDKANVPSIYQGLIARRKD